MRTKARKLIWSVPLVAVFAVVGALALFATLAPNDASAQANVEIPPGKPDGPHGLRPTVEGIRAGGDPAGLERAHRRRFGPRRYRIDISDNDGYTWVALESDFRGTSYTHDGPDGQPDVSPTGCSR